MDERFAQLLSRIYDQLPPPAAAEERIARLRSRIAQLDEDIAKMNAYLAKGEVHLAKDNMQIEGLEMIAKCDLVCQADRRDAAAVALVMRAEHDIARGLRDRAVAGRDALERERASLSLELASIASAGGPRG